MALKREPLTIDRQYLRLGELVKITGVSQTCIRDQIRRGNLEAFRVGRAVLVPRDAVDRWIHGDTPTQPIAA